MYLSNLLVASLQIPRAYVKIQGAKLFLEQKLKNLIQNKYQTFK